LDEHYRSDLNRKYAILRVEHEADTGDYRTWQEAELDYQVSFSAIPDDLPFRALRTVRRPLMSAQTAVVVGKSGEEIWTDKHGRVKVQFHWDREGKKDENSSCWVRVSSAWAGKNWGAIHIPRIGQEVIIDFIEGDPDRPIVTGRVYNADQTPPYALPTNQTQSGIKSRSSKKGGTEDFNEIRFEDKKDSELIYVHAQKDKQVMVENDRTEEVGHDEMITIKNDRTELVEGNEKITIKKDRTEEVEGKETITITKDRTEEVKANEKVKIGKDRSHDIGSNEKLKIGAKRNVDVSSDDQLKVGSKLTIEANSNISVKSAGGKIVIESPLGIELKVGASTIKITPASIELKSPMIKVKGDAQVEVKAPMVMQKADAMMQIGGPMTQVKGDGLLMCKGGITMIN
jgi:type VI secretion system secreted protein VgrG